MTPKEQVERQLVPSPDVPSEPELHCMDCVVRYGDFPLDTTLPDAQWKQINPTEGGVLCASCLVSRASKLPGAVAVRAQIEFDGRSQPVPSERERTICTLCRAEYLKTGQQVGPSWVVWGPSYRLCKRCVSAGRDARRVAECQPVPSEPASQVCPVLPSPASLS